MVRDELAEQVHVLASKASTVKSILAWAGVRVSKVEPFPRPPRSRDCRRCSFCGA